MNPREFWELRDFLLIWIGQMVSTIGSRVSSFALGIWVLRTTNSTTEFAMTFMAMTLPSLLCSLVAGPLIDRWDRRRTMLFCDIACAITMFLLAVISLVQHLNLWAIYIALGTASWFDAFRGPAFSASIPLLTGPVALTRANALAQTGNAVAEIVGPVLAGMLILQFSLSGVLAIDGLTFIAGCVTLAFAHIPRTIRRSAEESNGYLKDAIEGWRYVRERPGLSWLLTISGTNDFLFSMACVVIAPFLLSFSAPVFVALQYAVSGLGLLIGVLVIVAWGGPKNKVHGVLLCSAMAGLCLAAHGLRPSLALVMPAGFLLFATMPITSSSTSTLWQIKVPTELHGRCFAIQRMVLNAATIAGYCIAGPLSEKAVKSAVASTSIFAPLLKLAVGTGPARGYGLMFLAMGMAMASLAMSGYGIRALRNLDHSSDVATTALISNELTGTQAS